MTLPLNHRSDYMGLILRQLLQDRTEAQARRELGYPPANAAAILRRAHVDTRGPGFVVIEGDRK